MDDNRFGKIALGDLTPLRRALRKAIPEVYAGFGELHKAVFTPGALDVKTKELMAFAIAVVEQCDGCIAAHAQGAVRAGASRQEAAEAIGVALLMTGGPATFYGPRAFAEFCDVADAQHTSATA